MIDGAGEEAEDFADDDCVDADGEVYPEHDFGAIECRRCGAEATEEQG